jgi:hypothetical protein
VGHQNEIAGQGAGSFGRGADFPDSEIKVVDGLGALQQVVDAIPCKPTSAATRTASAVPSSVSRSTLPSGDPRVKACAAGDMAIACAPKPRQHLDRSEILGIRKDERGTMLMHPAECGASIDVYALSLASWAAKANRRLIALI